MTYHDVKLQRLISWTLRAGVLLASALGVIGGALLFASHPPAADFHHFQGSALPFSHADRVFAQIFAAQTPLHVRGLSIIQAGILVLLATPVVRVLFSVIGFALERDRLYVLITLAVLLVLALSIGMR